MRSFPVFVLYSLKAASRIALNCEDDPGFWGGEDIGRFVGDDIGKSESTVKHFALCSFLALFRLPGS